MYVYVPWKMCRQDSPVWLLLPEPFPYRSSKQKCPQSSSIFLCISQRRSLPLFNCLPRFCFEQPAALKRPSWYDVLRCPFRQRSPGEWNCLLVHHRWLLSPAHSSGSLENSRAAPLNSCYILGLIPSPFPWCGCTGAGGGNGEQRDSGGGLALFFSLCTLMSTDTASVLNHAHVPRTASRRLEVSTPWTLLSWQALCSGRLSLPPFLYFAPSLA